MGCAKYIRVAGDNVCVLGVQVSMWSYITKRDFKS